MYGFTIKSVVGRFMSFSQCQNLLGSERSFTIQFINHSGLMLLTGGRAAPCQSSHNPAQSHAALTHLYDFDISLLIFGRFSFSFQATRSPPACRRAASAGALAPPCARAATTSWTAEGKDLPPFQPTCQRAWLRCKHHVSSVVSAVRRPHAVKAK